MLIALPLPEATPPVRRVPLFGSRCRAVGFRDVAWESSQNQNPRKAENTQQPRFPKNRFIESGLNPEKLN